MNASEPICHPAVQAPAIRKEENYALNAQTNATAKNDLWPVAIPLSPIPANSRKRALSNSHTPDTTTRKDLPASATWPLFQISSSVPLKKQKNEASPAQLFKERNHIPEAKKKPNARDAKLAAKADKEAKKRGKEAWKAWCARMDQFDRTTRMDSEEAEVALSSKDAQQRYKVRAEELKCLLYAKFPNPHGAAFAPMKKFREVDVRELAYRKTAYLAGLTYRGVDEDEFLELGRDLFEKEWGLIVPLSVERARRMQTETEDRNGVKEEGDYKTPQAIKQQISRRTAADLGVVTASSKPVVMNKQGHRRFTAEDIDS